jgi:hypothetical protein
MRKRNDERVETGREMTRGWKREEKKRGKNILERKRGHENRGEER